jgi:hypothetical protein
MQTVQHMKYGRVGHTLVSFLKNDGNTFSTDGVFIIGGTSQNQ